MSRFTNPLSTNGTDGADGQGVPTGGTTGQVLAKIDGTDFNTQWSTPSSGGSYTLLASGNCAGSNSITLSNIPQNYKDIFLEINGAYYASNGGSVFVEVTNYNQAGKVRYRAFLTRDTSSTEYAFNASYQTTGINLTLNSGASALSPSDYGGMNARITFTNYSLVQSTIGTRKFSYEANFRDTTTNFGWFHSYGSGVMIGANAGGNYAGTITEIKINGNMFFTGGTYTLYGVK